MVKSFVDNKALLVFGCAAGIVCSLGIYGFQQERIMAFAYDGEEFTDTVFLVLCNRLFSMAFAVSMICRNGEQWRNTPPILAYFAVSVSNIVAATCQYEALRYISFPTQMIIKSASMGSVMVWSIIVARNLRKFSLKEWAIALGVTGGCMIFLLAGKISSKRLGKFDSLYGLILMVGYVAFDGFTSTAQEMLFKAPGAERATKYNQMLYTNGCAAAMSLVWLVPSGSLAHALGFAVRHPQILLDASVLSAGATLGQFCIYTTIQEFGAVVFAALITVRQVTSTVFSLLYYGHPLSVGQFVGLLMVFVSLFYKSYIAKQKDVAKKALMAVGAEAARAVELCLVHELSNRGEEEEEDEK